MIGKLAAVALVAAPPLAVSARYGRVAGYGMFVAAALLLLAGARRAHRRTRDVPAPASVRTPAQADVRGKRMPRWVWMGGCAAAGVGLLVLTLGVWVVGGGLLLVISVLALYRYLRPRAAEISVTDPSTPLDSVSWMAELPDRVADAVDAARLVRGHADAIGAAAGEAWDDDDTDAEPDVLARLAALLRAAPVHAEPGERVQLVGRPKAAGERGATMLLDLNPARVTPRDVMRTEETWRRHLGADTLAWEPVNARTLRLTAYLDHPLTQVVDWRDLTPVHEVDHDLDLAPMGVTALPGQQATFWWRGSQLIVGTPGSGKTVTLRGMLRGLVVQQVPTRVTLADNKGDFVDWSTGSRLGGYARSHADCVDLVVQHAALMDHRYDGRDEWPDGEYALTPTPWQPAEVLIVSELLPLLADGTPAQNQAAGRAISRIAQKGREAAFAVWAAAQTATKQESDQLARVRDLFPGRILHRVPNASMVAPALGVGVEAGAAAHRIPRALTGVGYYLDPHTGHPVMFRAAFSPRSAQTELAAQLGLAHFVTDKKDIA